MQCQLLDGLFNRFDTITVGCVTDVRTERQNCYRPILLVSPSAPCSDPWAELTAGSRSKFSANLWPSDGEIGLFSPLFVTWHFKTTWNIAILILKSSSEWFSNTLFDSYIHTILIFLFIVCVHRPIVGNCLSFKSCFSFYCLVAVCQPVLNDWLIDWLIVSTVKIKQQHSGYKLEIHALGWTFQVGV